MFFIGGRLPELQYLPLAKGRNNILFVVFITGTLFTLNAEAQHRVPLTLAEAEDIAMGNEPGQASLSARASAFEEQAVAAAQLPDPTLRVGLANFPINSGSFSTEGMTQAQLGIRQVFPRGRSRALSSVRLRSLAAELGKSAEARSRDVLTATRTAWLDAYLWQRAQQIVTESRPFFADLVSVTRSMYAVGRKTQHDVLRAELELSRLDDRLIETGRARAEAQAELSRWLGTDAYRPIAMKLPGWQQLPPLDDLRQDLTDHPSLAAADASISARQSGIDLAKENYKAGWALDLVYGYREGSLPDGEPRSDFVSLAASVDLPLFSKNRQDRQLASALQERRAAVETKNELHAQLQSQLDLQYARWSDLTRRLALYDSQILGQSEAQAQSALQAYQSDTGDFSDVMRGYIDDLNTRLEYTRLQIERAQSYAVLANLGGILQ